jgi:hypothetical protein
MEPLEGALDDKLRGCGERKIISVDFERSGEVLNGLIEVGNGFSDAVLEEFEKNFTLFLINVGESPVLREDLDIVKGADND